MSTYLDFESSKNGKSIPDSKNGFRDFLLLKKLKTQNGPLSYTSSSYQYKNLSDYPNLDLGNVDDNRVKILTDISNTNIFKPINYLVIENLNTLPRRANLNLYPYFIKSQNHSLVSILNTDNFNTESELFKFSANFIKNDENGPIKSRIRQNLFSNLVNGSQSLTELDNRITVNGSDTDETTNNMLGKYSTKSKIPNDYLTNPLNQIQKPINESIINGVDYVGTLVGIDKISSIIKPSELLLQYTGSGQKKFLFDNLSYSKYNPNYIEYNGIINTLLSLNGPYIGNDVINDVRYTMSDYKDRIVKSNYYLSLMFDETQARLFKIDKNIGNGGGIAGKLTWISTKSKNKIGLYNEEFNSESVMYNSSLSTKYNFKEGSILQVTQDLINSLPTDSNRFTHVANAIDQTSRMFKDGDQVMSKGSAVKFTDKFNNKETGVEYCRVWTKDRSYMNYSDTMRKTGLLRKFNSSVLSTPWNLNIYPNSNGKIGEGSFDSSTNMEKYGSGFRAKKYMFSIENLSWKTSRKENFTYEDLPYSERGLNGGRVMWFPPYGLKITEQNDIKWDENVFIGRPEPIFTYQSTSRSISLEFKIVVDHPSVLNLLTREHFKKMSDEEADNYINAFFAGCVDINFYDLVRRYSMLESNDILMIQNYLNAGGKDTNILKQLKTNIGNSTITKPSTSSIINKKFTFDLYFDNAIPEGVNTVTTTNSFSTLHNNYVNGKDTYIGILLDGLNKLKNSTWNDTAKKDYEILTSIKPKSKPSDVDFDKLKINLNNQTVENFNKINNSFIEYGKTLSEIKDLIVSKSIKNIIISVESSASAPDSIENNKKLSYRRSYSVIKDIVDKLSNDTTSSESVISKITWGKNLTSDITPNIEYNGENELKIPLKSFGYDTEGEVIFKNIQNNGENKIINAIDCNKTNIPLTDGLGKTIPTVFWCRNSHVNIEYNKIEIINGETYTTNNPPIINTVNTTTTTNLKPNIDILKKIVMKILGEQYYFKKLESDSPLQFSSLKEKLKYFHPAFHSTTPEGLNSRLTFLHQCARPGDTIPIKGVSDINDEKARNTSFGPPPIIVIRIGDFYHTKAVIRSYNISYEDSQWDLNPEGIGVQPTLANITLQLSLIGGQGMENTVNEIQNALSSNFYANTEVYDEKSTATENRTLFNKEILTGIIEYENKKINQTSKDLVNPSGVSVYNPIGNINFDNNTINYNEIITELYSVNEKYTLSYNVVFNSCLNVYGSKISSFILGKNNYRVIDNYSVYTNDGEVNVALFGEYRDCDITKFTNNLNMSMNSVIDKCTGDDGVIKLFGMDIQTNPYTVNDYLTKTFKKILSININDIAEEKNILIENRNELIKILDKLNFIVETGHDGFVISETEKTVNGRTLLEFSKTVFYNEYKSIINHLNNNFNHYYDKINNDYNFHNTEMNNDQFLEFLSYLITKEEVKTVITDLTNAYKVSKDNIKKITKILNGNGKEQFKLTNKKIPVINKNLSLKYTYVDGFVFNETQKNKLIKVNNNQTNKESSLNYYRK